jgi:hypothetical protein
VRTRKERLVTAHLIDVALAFIGLEVIVLLAVRARLGRGLRPVDLIGQLLAGLLLMLAVRCAVAGADPRWILLLVTASFPAHVFDLARRSRATSRPS